MSKLNDVKMQFENEEADGVFTAETLEALAGCEDIMPGSLCRELDVPEGSTFKQGVASVREAEEEVRSLRQNDESIEKAEEAF